mgnify:CR=1 FL=1
METKNKNKLILCIFFGFYLLLGFITYDDYGISIEEHTQLYFGVHWLNYIVNFFEIDLFKDKIFEKIVMGRYLMFPQHLLMYFLIFKIQVYILNIDIF